MRSNTVEENIRAAMRVHDTPLTVRLTTFERNAHVAFLFRPHGNAGSPT